MSRETFFSVKSESRGMRPTSVATEFVDTDWDEDDIISEPEDNSPRVSLQSVSQALTPQPATRLQKRLYTLFPYQTSTNHQCSAVWPAQFHNHLDVR